jgi:hypothetical protein
VITFQELGGTRLFKVCPRGWVRPAVGLGKSLIHHKFIIVVQQSLPFRVSTSVYTALGVLKSGRHSRMFTFYRFLFIQAGIAPSDCRPTFAYPCREELRAFKLSYLNPSQISNAVPWLGEHDGTIVRIGSTGEVKLHQSMPL